MLSFLVCFSFCSFVFCDCKNNALRCLPKSHDPVSRHDSYSFKICLHSRQEKIEDSESRGAANASLSRVLEPAVEAGVLTCLLSGWLLVELHAPNGGMIRADSFASLSRSIERNPVSILFSVIHVVWVEGADEFLNEGVVPSLFVSICSPSRCLICLLPLTSVRFFQYRRYLAHPWCFYIRAFTRCYGLFNSHSKSFLVMVANAEVAYHWLPRIRQLFPKLIISDYNHADVPHWKSGWGWWVCQCWSNSSCFCFVACSSFTCVLCLSLSFFDCLLRLFLRRLSSLFDFLFFVHWSTFGCLTLSREMAHQSPPWSDRTGSHRSCVCWCRHTSLPSECDITQILEGNVESSRWRKYHFVCWKNPYW